MKVLSILSDAYRATLEEQDDTVLWFTQAVSRAGAEVDILLRSSAANYLAAGQSVSPLAIGRRAQRNAPDVHRQVRDLDERGVGIFVIEEDLAAYGLDGPSRFQRAQVVRTAELPALVSRYDAVWHW